MKFSFFSKMTLAILFPVLITLVIMSGTMYLKANDLLRTNVREQVALLAKSQGEALSAAITAYKDMVLELSHNSDILNAVASDMQGDSRRFESYRDAAIGKLKRIEKMSPAYYGLGITDKQGKIILHSKDSRMGESFSQKLFIKNALNGTMKPEIVPLGEHSMGLALAQPIYIGKQISGAAFLVINLNIMAEEITDYITFANSGAVGVHDGNGLQIMHKYRDYIGLQEGNTPYFREMKGQSSGIVFFEYKNEKWVWYFYQIPWLDWYVTCSVKQADLEAGAKDLFMISTVISIASILVLFTIIFIFAKRTAKSLSGIEKISREVSEGKLNLSREEDLLLDNIGKRTDEIGGMAVSFKQMIVALIDTIRDAKAAHKNGMVEAAKQLEKIVESCSTATQELSAQIQESSNGAEMQADRISATVTAVEEMNSTILEVTQNTVQTAQIANNTKQKAEESEAVVNDFMGSIRKVEASTDTLKADMNKLFGHVQDINQVMGVISDLADQTNLLALNAAIEAARAGEFGRGFAVVADEVRKLAEKTMASTARVSNAVIAIKTSTESSMHQVDDTVALVNTAIELATSCHTALEEIMHMASESAERIGSIAVASEEQSSTSEEITHSINEINHIVSQTSNTMREANIAIMELAKQSEIITGMINNMKSGN